MPDFALQTMDGGETRVAEDRLTLLAAQLRGSLVTPLAPDYDEVRRVWNAMIDRRPGLIVRCAGTADVVHAVNFARERRLLVSVRGGGHNIAGASLCEGGMVIDLSPLRTVRVDPAARTVTVGGGATLGDLDRETQAFGLVVPLGINSTTGVAGLTLGAGFGWLSRRFGLSIDNLLAADVVTADGRFRRASADENAELFWALRGGGGNFGVVTFFTFRCQPLGPEIYAGVIVHPFDQAGNLLRRYRDLAAAMPDDLTCWVVLRKAPQLPFLPAEVHGREVVVLPVVYTGDPAQGPQAVAAIRALGTPLGEHLGPMPYVAWQSTFDALLAPGARNYWKTHNFTAVEDGLLDRLVAEAGRLPSPQCEVFLGQLGGAAGRLPADATAYPHRDAAYVMNVHARWTESADDAACIAWARGVFDAAAPYATGGAYLNFMTADEQRSHAAFGTNYARLAAVKRDVDPENLFRGNQTVAPAAG
jgi:FAD/FMN-containing dehydrogenase